MMHRPSSSDTTNTDNFFKKLFEYIKPRRFWKLKDKPFAKSNTMMIKEKMLAKKN